MAMITWQEAYSVEVVQIDDQHRKWVALLNSLQVAMGSGQGNDVLRRTINEVVEYTKYHFATEERLMAAYHYPGLQHHQAEHQELTRKVVELQEQYGKDGVPLTVATLSFLCDWLIHHILGTDHRCAAFLRAKGVV